MSVDLELKTALEVGTLAVIAAAVHKARDLEGEDEMGWTPLFYGVARGDERAIQLLLDAGADPKHLDSARWSASMHAAVDGKLSIAKMLESVASAR